MDTAEITRKFHAIGPKLASKALVRAMRMGANIVRKDAQQRARRFDNPATPAKVWKEVVVRVNNKQGKRVNGVVVQVGVKGGARRYKDTKENRKKKRVGGTYEGPGAVYYWRFLEFGTKFAAAQPFMRPALASNVDAVMNAAADALRNELDAEYK